MKFKNSRNQKFLYFLSIILIFVNCSNNDDDTNGNNEPTINDVFYLKGTLNGKPFSISGKLTKSDLPNKISSFGICFFKSPSTCNFFYETLFEENTDFATASGQFFFDTPNVFNRPNDKIDNEELEELPKIFNVKELQYNTPENDLEILHFQYTPKSLDGSTYGTSYGSQTGSVFKINSYTQLKPSTFNNIPNTIIIIEGTMNCILYESADNTNTLRLTEGIFRIPVISQAPKPDPIPVN